MKNLMNALCQINKNRVSQSIPIPPAAVLSKQERQRMNNVSYIKIYKKSWTPDEGTKTIGVKHIEVVSKPKDEPLIWQDYNEGLQLFSWCQCGALKEQSVQHDCQHIESMNDDRPVLMPYVDKTLISDTDPSYNVAFKVVLFVVGLAISTIGVAVFIIRTMP